MLTDPLFPTAAFLPLTDAAHALAMAEVSITYCDGGAAMADDFGCYHNESESV
jgi:hypothetical protein